MKFAGHTNATYGYATEQAVDLFIRLGFDGMDVGCNEISGITFELPPSRRREIAAYVTDQGFCISNLACYAGGELGITAEDPAVRAVTMDEVRRHIVLASDLGSHMVRVFSGKDAGEGVAERGRAFDNAVEAYRLLSDYAGDYGVTLLVENHPFTITCTAQQTADLVRAVDRRNVRILYDPSNLIVYAGDMDVEGNFLVQKELIAYVHMKDQAVLEDGSYSDTVIGRGAVPWSTILKLLGDEGYGGFLAMEYQRGKRSTALLPDPDIGLKEGLDFLKEALRTEALASK